MREIIETADGFRVVERRDIALFFNKGEAEAYAELLNTAESLNTDPRLVGEIARAEAAEVVASVVAPKTQLIETAATEKLPSQTSGRGQWWREAPTAAAPKARSPSNHKPPVPGVTRRWTEAEDSVLRSIHSSSGQAYRDIRPRPYRALRKLLPDRNEAAIDGRIDRLNKKDANLKARSEQRETLPPFPAPETKEPDRSQPTQRVRSPKPRPAQSLPEPSPKLSEDVTQSAQSLPESPKASPAERETDRWLMDARRAIGAAIADRGSTLAGDTPSRVEPEHTMEAGLTPETPSRPAETSSETTDTAAFSTPPEAAREPMVEPAYQFPEPLLATAIKGPDTEGVFPIRAPSKDALMGGGGYRRR